MSPAITATEPGRSSSSASGPAAPTARGRLAAYGLWQLRDYVITKGIATLLVTAILLFPVYMAVGADARAGAVPLGTYRVLLRQFSEQFINFGILFAANGIVAEDRKFGYYRFYFAKPVSVAAFYAQKFFVHLLGFLLLGAVLLGAFAALFHPLLPPMFFPVLVLMFIGFGGIGFLLSAVTVVDWISLVGFTLVSLIAWTTFGDDPGIRGLLVHALPPVHRVGPIYDAMIAGEPLPTRWLVWISAYGLACFIAGLIVLSRRRLATT